MIWLNRTEEALKRLTGIFMSILLAFSMPVSAFAGTTVSFSYPDGAFDHEEMNASVVYDDAFFQKKPTSRNDQLALLSAGAAVAVYNENDIRDFLKTCGFTNKRDSVESNDSADLSFNFAKKKIGKKTLVAVILQGTSSEAEWRSNLDLGFDSNMNTTMVHAGFNKTEKLVHKKLTAFLKKNGLKKGQVCFWVTGHSRGAAVGNIMAKRLTDVYGKGNVFAYTFATPKVAKISEKQAKKYTNIFNYLNPQDIVTQVPTKDSKTLETKLCDSGMINKQALETALAVLGLDESVNYSFGTYRRFGRDITMTKAERDTMKESFSQLTGADFRDDNVSHNHCQSCYLSWVMG